MIMMNNYVLNIDISENNLIEQKEPKFNFQNDETIINQKSNSVSYFKKIISPTAEELKKHKEYLKNNLKKNFF